MIIDKKHNLLIKQKINLNLYKLLLLYLKKINCIILFMII